MRRDGSTMIEAQALVLEEQERLAYLSQWLEWVVSDGTYDWLDVFQGSVEAPRSEVVIRVIRHGRPH